jgi:hypothetical protein
MSENQDPPSEQPTSAQLDFNGEIVRASVPELIGLGVATAFAAKPFIEMAVKRDTDITVAQTRADADVAIAHIQAEAAIRVAEIHAEAAQAGADVRER